MNARCHAATPFHANALQLSWWAHTHTQLRSQKDRLLTMKAHVSGVGHKASLMASQIALGETMGGVTKVCFLVLAQLCGSDERMMCSM